MSFPKDVSGKDPRLHYQGPFFVMLAGRPKHPDGHIYVFGDGCNLRQAHQSAESHYRKEHRLATNVFVQTEKLHEATTFEEAERFVERLEKVMVEAQEPSGG